MCGRGPPFCRYEGTGALTCSWGLSFPRLLPTHTHPESGLISALIPLPPWLGSQRKDLSGSVDSLLLPRGSGEDFDDSQIGFPPQTTCVSKIMGKDLNKYFTKEGMQ